MTGSTRSTVTVLARRLGTGDAVVIGLGSMIGAGVFSAFSPAAAAAGSGLLVGLAIAAAVAYCNAVASAQLAAEYPASGGTYVYGRERLGAWWGFIAGWGFVIGKTASCAAMTLTFASHAVPGPTSIQRIVGLLALAAMTVVNLRGIERTAVLARVLVTITIGVLATAVALIASSSSATIANLGGPGNLAEGGLYGTLQAGGLLFFAFAGYARIATLGEEVREPERTIPRAIQVALGITVAVYVAVGVSLLVAIGPAAVAAGPTPIARAVDAVGAAWAMPIVRVGAAVASLGALLALLAGIGRTALAMAREGDLPRWLANVDPRHAVPDHAELAVAAAVALLVVTADLRGAIGFSSFGVLAYYAIANAAAFTQTLEHRRGPRWVNATGFGGCVALVATLPTQSVAVGSIVFAIGLAGRWLVARRVGRRG